MSRAAATGGSRSYRGKTPVNWYFGLAMIIILGLLSVGFARYEFVNSSPSSPHSATWYAGLSFVRCGTTEPALPASARGSGVTTPGSGVLTISLGNKAQATLGRFVAGYPGLVLTSTKLGLPGAPVLSNGERCPKGTPDAGRAGAVRVVSWSNFSQTAGRSAGGDPGALPLTNGQLATVAFVPAGTKVPKPPQSTISAVLSSIAGTPPTSTPPSSVPAPPGSTTPAPPGSTTPAPPGSTTPAPPGSTATTTGGSSATTPSGSTASTSKAAP